MPNYVGCWKCGKTVTEDDATCPHCGATLPAKKRELELPPILLATTSHVDGRPAEKYLGVVTGEAPVPTNLLGSLFGGTTGSEQG
jgi:DNA-directed RNA polymerase subunit RPC12/RpoP